MNLISFRPTAWSEVVGQDRVVSLLKSLLTTGKFLPRGFILKGPWGLGKTSVAYLLSRALMCSGDDPLGCGKCPSCRFIDQETIEHDADFFETDAAEHPGVQDARNLMDCMAQPPITGKRRVSLIDEAHRLSPEAWDVFLKPLERPDTDSVFMFVTTDDNRIPKTIQSRCLPLTFYRATDDVITGLMASIASRNNIDYELDAIKDIAKHSKGIIREAVRWLGFAAALGKVNRENVDKVLDNPLESVCYSILLAISHGDQTAAVKLADDGARVALPTKVIETTFSLYAKSPWSEPSSELARIAEVFPNIKETSAIFLKWLATPLIPADALPLFVYELMAAARVSKPVVSKSVSRTLPNRNVVGNASSSQAILKGEVI